MKDQSATVDQDHVAAAITYALTVRTDWTAPELDAAAELARRHRDAPTEDQIARSIMAAASDPSVRKPAYVPASRYWKDLDKPTPPPTIGHGRAGHECRECGQAGSVSRPPAYCPGCGQAWDPVTPTGDSPTHQAGTSCSTCGHTQAGRFPYCARCGQAMAYARAAERPPELDL